AIEINGISIETNKKAFLWGRRAAFNLDAVSKVAFPAEVIELKRVSSNLDELIERRTAFLTEYQNAAYAQRYLRLIEATRAAEAKLGSTRLTEAVARYYFKLMAYKDEYEVARLFSDGAFMDKVNSQFEGDFKLKFHLAPPLWAKRDSHGHLMKRPFGSWTMRAFGLLAKLRGLRGSAFDPFGHTAERRAERALIVHYEQTVKMMLAKLAADNLESAIGVASVPEEIRGYGHIKEASLKEAAHRETDLLAAFTASVTDISAVRAA
ncbi:MAG: DUF6537 domain-containing protein, partial [Burkholderiaceae bacterium]